MSTNGVSEVGSVTELPPSLMAQAEAWLEGDQQPATARDAATVLIVRDGEDGLEVLLMQRVATMAFAAGMTVYPGGRVDPRDSADAGAVGWYGPDAAWWGRELRCAPQLAQALVCAAVRETFEECGVLLAGAAPSADGAAEGATVGAAPRTGNTGESGTTGDTGAAAADVVTDTHTPEWEEQRVALLDRKVSLRELLADRGLAVRADLLRPWAHWITPEFEPRRYDTRFFLAALPDGQQGRHVGGEADHTHWWRPADALAAFEAGELAMLPPTVATLTDLSAAADVAEALVLPREPVTYLPRLVRTETGFGLRLEAV